MISVDCGATPDRHLLNYMPQLNAQMVVDMNAVRNACEFLTVSALVLLHLSVSEYICNLSILNRGNLSSLWNHSWESIANEAACYLFLKLYINN